MEEGKKIEPKVAIPFYYKLIAAISAAAVSLFSTLGTDLFEGLLSTANWKQAGCWGIWLWNAVFDSSHMSGMAALRVAIVLLTVLIASKGQGGRRGFSSFLALLVPGLVFALTMPWGPESLFFLLAAGILLAGTISCENNSHYNNEGHESKDQKKASKLNSPVSLGLGLAILFIWPWLDRGFWLGALLFALMVGLRRSPSRDGSYQKAGMGRGALAVAALIVPLVNPAGFHSLFSGEAFLPFVASWVGHPGYSISLPASPLFWLVFLPFALLLYRGWGKPGEVAIGVAAACAALAVKTMAPLPALLLLSPTRDGEDESGAEGVPLWKSPYIHALFFPLLIWNFMRPLPMPLQREAQAALLSLPLSASTILTEPAWRTETAMRVELTGADAKSPQAVTRRVKPSMGVSSLMAFRAKYPGGLRPPFLLEPEPDADIVLAKSRYPKPPYRRELQAGWHLVSAGNQWALFCRETPEMKAWLDQNALKVYSPYYPIPTDKAQMELALAEARRLIESDPSSFLALRDAGRMETDLGMIQEAEEHLMRAVQTQPNDAEAWNDIGVVFQKKGQNQEAIDAYTRAINLDPLEVLPRTNLAGLHASTGNLAEAEAILTDVLRKKPAFNTVRRMLANLYMMQGRAREAADLIAAIPLEQRIPEDMKILAPNPGPGGAR